MNMRTPKNGLLIVVLSLISGFGGAWFFHLITRHPEEKPVGYHAVPSGLLHTNNTGDPVNFVNASSASTASVVYIKTARTAIASANWFDFFFNGVPQNQVVINSGSGVIFSKDGFIVTNNHVIEKADNIEVVFHKRSYKAKVVGTDPSTDLSVLKIEATDLPAIQVSSSRHLRVGDWVLAVGNPFNLTSTVTAGIVSAKGRNINIVKGSFPIESFIQTDAAINPGNSGGALVNINGELVGINTAILSQTGSYAGYGFAVPSDIVVKVVKDIMEFGEVQNAYLGIEVEELNTETAKKYGLQELNGVAVSQVLKGGPAEKLGIVKGDVITQLAGAEIDSKADYQEQLSYYRPGDKIHLTFKREGKTIEGGATLTNRDGTTELLKKEIFTSTVLGTEMVIMPRFERQRLGIETGIKVIKIKPGGLFSRMGIAEGFVITAINGQKMNTPKEVSDALEKVHGRVIIEGLDENGQRGYYSFLF